MLVYAFIFFYKKYVALNLLFTASCACTLLVAKVNGMVWISWHTKTTATADQAGNVSNFLKTFHATKVSDRRQAITCNANYLKYLDKASN